MFTPYEKIILAFNSFSILIAGLNLSISVKNLRANRRVARHASDLNETLKKNTDTEALPRPGGVE